MRKILLELQKYLDEVAGILVDFREKPEILRKLPVFINQKYDLYVGVLIGREYFFLVWKGRTRSTPKELVKHATLIRSRVGRDIIFVFPQMEAYQRKRLIQNQVPFIVPGRQLFIPERIIDLRESSTGTSFPAEGMKEVLSAPAQLMLLSYLHVEQSDDRYLSQWASLLGYSRMTVSRAWRELVSFDLCEPEKKGKRIHLHFSTDRQQLWETAQPFLRNPVLKRVPIMIIQKPSDPLYEAGVSALAHFTRISGGSYPEFAIDNAGYLSAECKGWLEESAFLDTGCVLLERWAYPPAVLAGDNHIVDRLSLYLTLRDNQDERIQDALDDMIGGMEW